MNSLLRSTPLIINLPVDTEASQEYFEQHLIDNETAFLEAIIIAEKLANVPAIMASSRPISVAVSSSSVIIGIKLAQIERWADSSFGDEPFWFFSLRRGEALPLMRNNVELKQVEKADVVISLTGLPESRSIVRQVSE